MLKSKRKFQVEALKTKTGRNAEEDGKTDAVVRIRSPSQDSIPSFSTAPTMERRGSLKFNTGLQSKLASFQLDCKENQGGHIRHVGTLRRKSKTRSELESFYARNMENTFATTKTLEMNQSSSGTGPRGLSSPVELKWERLLSNPDWRNKKELIELMKKGVPESIRGNVWKVFLRSDELKSKYSDGYYQRLVELSEEVEEDARKEIFQIDKDLGRTMPHCPQFKTEEGVAMLKRVLYAYALRYPDVVGYCQGMNFICAGLLTVLSEEDTFWCMCILVESRLGYYSPTMISLKVDQSVLNRLISYSQPKLYRHMNKLGISTRSFTTSWFLCLCMENPLPYTLAIKFWDYLFCFGDEMLFHMALEIFFSQKDELIAMDDADELLYFMLHGIAESLNEECFVRMLTKVGTLHPKIASLRTYYQSTEIIKFDSHRMDCTSLATKFGFDGPEEVELLWKLFVSPEPWDVLLTESHTEVSWFALAIHRACYPREPDSFCAHGLMSGFLHRLFDVIDVNKTGNVTFKRYLKTVQTLRYATREERMQLCFGFYDFDGDGQVSLADLKLGVTLISDMVEGYKHEDKKKKRMELCLNMIRRALLIEDSERKIVLKSFESGPFGLQLKTNGLGTFPIVNDINLDATKAKGIEIGWELLGINNKSFKDFDEKSVYDAIAKVEFPAVLKFRAKEAVGKKIEDAESYMLSSTRFAQVIQMHAKTYAIFRLHGTILEHLNQMNIYQPTPTKQASSKKGTSGWFKFRSKK